ncbi:hypothetical protein [Peribacillus frigoritolerans]|uniref:hypothetical protein n=1 Tax=Peribacillus frigoritolerans TaxID=450367 RepID=UPI003D2AC7B4
MSEVKVWYMTEEERLAYIEKHPIVPSEEKPNKSILAYGERRKKLKEGERGEN